MNIGMWLFVGVRPQREALVGTGILVLWRLKRIGYGVGSDPMQKGACILVLNMINSFELQICLIKQLLLKSNLILKLFAKTNIIILQSILSYDQT